MNIKMVAAALVHGGQKESRFPLQTSLSAIVKGRVRKILVSYVREEWVMWSVNSINESTVVSKIDLLLLTEFCEPVFTVDTQARSLQTIKIQCTPLCLRVCKNL